MFIAILVLLGIAGAIWYFARQQTQTVNLSHRDVTASNPSFEESEAKLKQAQQAALEVNSRLEKMTQKIDEVLAAAPAPEVTSPKVEAIEEETPVVEEAPVAPVVEAAPVVESPKPAKKKRRYYPKKK
jgi:cytoskeletal protein RodZ